MTDILAPNAEHAWSFFDKLFPNQPRYVEVMNSEGNAAPYSRIFSPNDKAEFVDFINECNSEKGKKNVYFLANYVFLEGNRGKANISHANFLHVDLDCKDYNGTPDEQLDKITGLLLDDKLRPKGVPRPSAVWLTGGGVQAVWRLAEPMPADEAAVLNQKLLFAMNGGMGTHDVSRLLRLPGTINWLNDKKRKSGRVPASAKALDYAPSLDANSEIAANEFDLKRYKVAGAQERLPSISDHAAIFVGQPKPLPSDLTEIIPLDEKWAHIIVTGESPKDKAYSSRSELVFAVIIWLLSKKVEPEYVLSILLDPQLGISAHVLDQPQPLGYAQRQVDRGIKHLANNSPDTKRSGDFPTIQVAEGELPANVDQAEQALLDGGVGIYQRGETMIRTYRLEESIFEDGVNRSGGAIVMRPVTAPWLKEQLARVANWERPVKGDKYVSCDPPAKIGNTYLARIGEWRLPVLNGVLQNPTLRRDGSIIQTEGYDQQTGLYLDCGNVSFPVIPDTPSRDDAIKALAVIERPFRDFSFVAPIDKAVALAAVLTALMRHNYPSAPMFVIDAPTAGTGKSLLAETIGVIATGSVPAVMSQGKTVEEDEKRLSSVLLAGDPIIVIDNCDREIRGDFICSMLTQRAAKIRPLGKSEIVKVPTRCLVLATGNNVILAGDISRRALVCRLDANSERPDLIRYDFDPRKEAVANRPELVTAGLTIIRAYLNSGDKPALPPIGSFEDWSMIRDALVWLGYPDISDTRERFLADDPNKNELLDTLCLWWECVGDSYISTADMSAGYAASSQSDVKKLAIHLVACTGHNAFNPRSVGKYLSKHVDRIAGGRVLRMKNGSNGSKRFQVVSSEPETPSPF